MAWTGLITNNFIQIHVALLTPLFARLKPEDSPTESLEHHGRSFRLLLIEARILLLSKPKIQRPHQ